MNQFLSGLNKLSAVSVLSIALIACGGAEERKVKYLEKGKLYLEEKNYDKAKIEFKNVLQIDPKFAAGYYHMGVIEQHGKNLRKALGNYKKAIELNPEYSEAKLALAKIYIIVGTEEYLQMSRDLSNQVLAKEPSNHEAKLILATIDYKQGRKEKAVKDIEAIVHNNYELSEGVSLLASIYENNGRVEDAVSLLEKGVEADADNIPLRINLAKILASQSKLELAEKYLKQVIVIDPDNYSLKIALSSFYSTSNQLDKAEKVLRDAIEQDDEDAQRYLLLTEFLASRRGIQQAEDELINTIKAKPDMYELKFAQVKLYESANRRDDAKGVLHKIVDDRGYDVNGVKAKLMLAGYLFDEGDRQAAKKYSEEVLAEYPNNNDALLISGKLALSDLDAITAINNLRTVVKNNPKNSEASLLLARAHELNKESSLAENELKKAIEINPVNPQVHINYAQFLLAKGRSEDAEAVIDKAIVYFKDNYNLLDLKLRLVSARNDEASIVSTLQQMKRATSVSADAYIRHGQYYQSKKDFKKAISEFEQAYQSSANKLKPLELIVQSYFAMNQVDKAKARVQQLLDKDPGNAIAPYVMGTIYLSEKNFDKARSYLNTSIANAEQWFKPYKVLASTYMSEGNFDGAITVYQRAVKSIKQNALAKIELAGVYERQKEYDSSKALYKEVLASNPSNKLAANNLAALMLDFGKPADIPKALELSRGFDKLGQSAFQDTLAWAYAKSGENSKAIELLKPIVERSPNVAVFRYHLGYALYHSGDKEAAKSHLEIAAKSEQIYPGKDDADSLLGAMN